MEDHRNLTIRRTLDGSLTLYVPSLDEHYHSTGGAVRESEHIYINAALRAHPSSILNVLEVGFGTGLNALLTINSVVRHKRKANYVAVEPFALPPDIVEQLHYAKYTDLPDPGDCIHKMHAAKPGIAVRLCKEFHFTMINRKIQDADLGERRFEVVFFDAFGPAADPEIWEDHVIRKVCLSMKPGGILTTFSVNGAVKRALKKYGCEIETLPGPPGKRHMLRAHKS